jgi:hypothetical protein
VSSYEQRPFDIVRVFIPKNQEIQQQQEKKGIEREREKKNPRVKKKHVFIYV